MEEFSRNENIKMQPKSNIWATKFQTRVNRPRFVNTVIMINMGAFSANTMRKSRAEYCRASAGCPKKKLYTV